MGFVEFLQDDDIYETIGTVVFLTMYFTVLWNATLPLYVHLIMLAFTECADSAYSHAERIQKWHLVTALAAHVDAENTFWHQGFTYNVLIYLQYKAELKSNSGKTTGEHMTLSQEFGVPPDTTHHESFPDPIRVDFARNLNQTSSMFS